MVGRPTTNALLTIPVLRFPQWHFCAKCRGLFEIPLDRTGKRVFCIECFDKSKKKRWLAQVPFVAMCDSGHLQDFPWRQWVHRSTSVACSETLRLTATGGASLSAQIVACDCGKVTPRSLGGITTAYPDGDTLLSKSLDSSKARFLCSGAAPWLGTQSGRGCGSAIRGSLRGAGNVYYGHSTSAIYLPREGTGTPTKLLEFLMTPGPAALIRLLEEAATPMILRKRYQEELKLYGDNVVATALDVIIKARDAATSDDSDEEELETSFRKREFDTLRTERAEADLVVRPLPANTISKEFHRYFATVTLVERLRETRVFTGFSRVFPENGQSASVRRALLWANPPRGRKAWLPAYVVYGEGIFFELNEAAVREWEECATVARRYGPLAERFETVSTQRQLRERSISPRLVLVHTLAHLLINRLTFECGYSSSSLRERLYVSSEVGETMAGFMIYTADGDADGTMGGLVRMGKPKHLEPILRRAVENAMWCSSDPVCMETGGRGGQGPDSLNLAACHSCALLPETACEEFNRLLDRAAIVGELGHPELGFFADLVR
jgi:hypothetical protein